MKASGTVVRAADVRAERTETGAVIRMLLSTGGNGAGLVRRMVDVPSGGVFAGTAGAAGELWFVVSGTARLRLDGEPGPDLKHDRGLLVPPGAAYQVTAGEAEPLRLDVVTLPLPEGEAPGEPDAAADSRSPGTADLASCDVEMTGDRKFRVLFGPGRGCEVATQFVGEIPPGRAPEHSHPYDEVVMILAGVGVAHLGGARHALEPGTCLHLPPGLPHCLENTGSQTLRVLGVFHPADSPAAKLAAEPRRERPAEYPSMLGRHGDLAMTTNDPIASQLAPDEVYIYAGRSEIGSFSEYLVEPGRDAFEEQARRGRKVDEGLTKVTLSDEELDRLRGQVQRITSKLEAAGDGPDAQKFAVDEITVHVGLSASGHFFFIASAGIEAAVDVTWRRQR